MLYLSDKPTTLYRGDRRPIKLYKGENLVTGYEYSEVSGTSLSVNNTYNDSVEITLSDSGEFNLVSRTPNWVTNGNFDSLDGWTWISNMNQSVTNSILYFEGKGSLTSSSLNRFEQPCPIYQGHKYFYKFKARRLNSYSLNAFIVGNTVYEWHSITKHILETEFKEFSGIFNNTGYNASSIALSSYNHTELDYYMVVDLTEIFGVGNEPTTAQCNTLFPKFIDKREDTVSVTGTTHTVKTFYPFTNVYTTAVTPPTLTGNFRIMEA